jgi:hypothetical protein
MELTVRAQRATALKFGIVAALAGLASTAVAILRDLATSQS